MNYPKIIALYRLERNGMIYDYLNATTKKEARETIKNNGGIVFAILTMEEAYKLAFCTEGYYYKGFKGILNAKDDKKVERVSDFLSQCFFYENDDIRASYESTINYKMAKCEVKIAHYEAEIKYWSKNDGWFEIVESYQNSINKVRQEMAEINKKDEEKQNVEKQATEFANNVEKMLQNQGATIIDKKVNVFKDMEEKYEGHATIIAKKDGKTITIDKFMTLWFCTVNEEKYISDSDLQSVIEEEFSTKNDIMEETTEKIDTKEQQYLGETDIMSDYERYLDMAYDLAWQEEEEEEEEEEVSKNVEEKVSEYEVKEWDYYLDMAYEESWTYDEEEEDLSENDEKEVARIMAMLDEEFGKYPDEILIDLSKNDERRILT